MSEIGDYMDTQDEFGTTSTSSATNKIMSTHYKFSDSMVVSEADHIKAIAAPLKLLGIEGFIYMRIYPDNSMIDFSTNLEWSELFFDNLYQEKYNPRDLYQHMCFANNVSLWINNPQNVIWQEGEKYFEFGNGISIFKQTSSYNTVYSFYSKSSNYEINNFYINNLDVLERFIIYFEERAEKIIQNVSQNTLILPSYYNKADNLEIKEQENLQTFISNISKDKMTSEKKINDKLLTSRQKECLRWMCMGKTAEEIGIILGCSQRTVEAHINNIKIKLECTKITQLIYMALKNGLVDNIF